ncbi:MAG: hypothetical protein BIFFINMI_01714 [Phycisphaerae bacterium]|nr:hypothetical protein [Phycisphaerae bacterium]
MLRLGTTCAAAAILTLAACLPARAGLTEIQYDSYAQGSSDSTRWSGNAMSTDGAGHLAFVGSARPLYYPSVARQDFNIADLTFTNYRYSLTTSSNYYGTSVDGRWRDASFLNPVDTFNGGVMGTGGKTGQSIAYYGGDSGGDPSMFWSYDNIGSSVTTILELQPQNSSGAYDPTDKDGATLAMTQIATSSTGGNHLHGLQLHGTPSGGNVARMFGAAGAGVYYFDLAARSGLVVDSGTPTYTVGTRTATTPTALTLQNESGVAITTGTISSLSFDADGDLWVLRYSTAYDNWSIEEYANQGGDTWKRLQSLYCRDIIPADQFSPTNHSQGDRANALLWYDADNLLVLEGGGWNGAGNSNQLFKFTAVAQVPEPATLALLGLGGLALAASRRRRAG